MANVDSNSNNLFGHILANSLFTSRQLTIIFKRMHSKGKAENMSSGAYYRQVKQCKEKVIAILYSVILLQSTGVLQPDTLATMNKLADQLGVMFTSTSSDISSSNQKRNDVMFVMDQLLKRMSKL